MRTREDDPLIDESPSWFEKFKTVLSGRSAVLALYLVLVVIAGTSNRVAFKIMQYATFNYAYFDSQFTTLIFVIVGFLAIIIRILTGSITPAMRQYPKYKFAIMGFFDSFSGLIVTVGGVKVAGIMQSLLLQGAVPMTMLFSILILRPTGCDNCKKIKKQLISYNLPFSEVSTLPATCTSEQCLSRVMVNGVQMVSYDMEEPFRNLASKGGKIVLEISSSTWGTHLRTYYTLMQYIGALVVLGGLGVSLSGGLKGQSSELLFELIFFSATIPMALSGVYKEIAFRDCDDMDVWYLNGWVAVFQFLIGLTYAPLAAVMSGLPIHEIPQNMYDGLLCWATGHNTIKLPGCLDSFPCGDSNGPQCCDSCNGSLSEISEVSAFWGIALYMSINICYNVLLVAVIKYGSAALMYISSTLVLPLSSIAFTLKPIMRTHSQPFTWNSGAGLGIVLVGLIIYRFIGAKRPPKEEDETTTLLVNESKSYSDGQ